MSWEMLLPYYGWISSRESARKAENEKRGAEESARNNAATAAATEEEAAKEKARLLLIGSNPQRLASSSGLTGSTQGTTARKTLLGA